MKKDKASGKKSVTDLAKRNASEQDASSVRGGTIPPEPIRVTLNPGQIVTPIAPVIRNLGG